TSIPNATGNQIGSTWCNSWRTWVKPAAQAIPIAAPRARPALIRTSSACCAGSRSRCGRGRRSRLRFISIGSAAGSGATTPARLHAVLVPVAPDAPHGETRTPDDADEAELLVPRPAVPDVQAEGDHDQQSRPVEDHRLPRRPRRDLVAALPPHEEDEERNREEERDPEQHPDREHGGIEVQQDDEERDQADDHEAAERGPIGEELPHGHRLASTSETDRKRGSVIEEGKPAPDFELQSDNGETVKLSNLRGRPVVLYFYPKDDTPGCTTEACEFRDAYDVFRERGAEVLGVSPDDVTSHEKFKTKYELPFTL